MEYGLAAIVLIALVAFVVMRPLSRVEAVEAKEEAEREELEAAKEAKYREIRDAELDHRMGKLSEADWKTVDRDLRGEAIEILRRLDKVEGRMPEVGRRASEVDASPPASGG